MSVTIDSEVLNFVKEAGEQFDKNLSWERYINKDGKYIALLWNKFRGEIKVYRLGEEIGIFPGYIHLNGTIINEQNFFGNLSADPDKVVENLELEFQRICKEANEKINNITIIANKEIQWSSELGKQIDIKNDEIEKLRNYSISIKKSFDNATREINNAKQRLFLARQEIEELKKRQKRKSNNKSIKTPAVNNE